METEYEAKFLDIDKDDVRARLEAAGAKMLKPKYLQKRWVFDLPAERHSRKVFVRVRDEGDKICMTWKRFAFTEKDNPDEIEIVVDSFDNAVDILTEIGCVPRSYQESYREWWELDDAEITIDTWPFMEPFVEIEGTAESKVENAAKKIGSDWSKALFAGVNRLYQDKYGKDIHIREMPKLTFSMPNPF